MNTLIVRHETEPVNARQNGSYDPFDNIDFTLDFNQRAILMNSIKISGRVAVRKGGNKLNNDEVLYDPTIGAHNFIDTITCGTEQQGVLETIQQYSRYVGMKSDTTNYETDTGTNLSRVVELKTYDIRTAFANLNIREANVPTGADGGVVDDDLSFVIAPDIIFNNAQGATDPSDVRVSYTKTGSLRLSLRVSRIADGLFGLGMDNTVSFSLVDVKCQFLSMPDENPQNQVITEVKAHVKQSILSNQANLSVRVPMVAKSFSGTFLPINESGSLTDNTQRREAINDMDTVQFLFNNNTMDLITYELKNRSEILRHYLNSMGSARKAQVNPVENSAGRGYGVGIEFSATDLTNNSFNIQLSSPTFNSKNQLLFGYFKGVVGL